LRAAEGCDAIAHLAAIPNPGAADDILFQVNVTGTQYILAAAEAYNISRVVLASSCCVYGFVFALHPLAPQYLPLDEAHPKLPQDLYGISKLLNEQTAAAYTRRTGMTTISLQLTTVMNFEDERASWRLRQLHYSNRMNTGELWGYIDVRDAARAFRLAVEVPREGSHAAIIAARDSFTPYDIRDLVREHYPSLAKYTDWFEAHSSLLDTRHAEEIMGFVAERRWRDVPKFAEIDAIIEKERASR
jgi:nucleoside-diphosphate-sugar epimerase